MLASLSGSLALLLGLAVMLLPLLGPELSRPRDSAWGALVLLLGLTLVTSADRLSGSPMLAVLCGGLLIGRLGSEVMQLRWRQLTPEEQQGLRSLARWQRSLPSAPPWAAAWPGSAPPCSEVVAGHAPQAAASAGCAPNPLPSRTWRRR
jgi:hypothetical protein